MRTEALRVVITGASSGIGRATALEFAKQKAFLTLCSRSRTQLEQVAQECVRRGARTLVFPLDTTDETQVKQCADKTIATFGTIDVWVNNAAVTMFGRIEDVPANALRRVIETNIIGYINGCRAAIPYMRNRNKGVIINVSSVAGITGQPLTSIYSLSKAAINNLGSCLRMELKDSPGVKVSSLILPTVDTPMFQHAANFTRKAVQAMPPVYAPERVGRVIRRLARRPRPQVVLGAPTNLVVAAKRLFPFLSEPLMNTLVKRGHFKNEPADITSGNLFSPLENQEKTRGGWLGRPKVKEAMDANTWRIREKITGQKT